MGCIPLIPPLLVNKFPGIWHEFIVGKKKKKKLYLGTREISNKSDYLSSVSIF